MAVFLLIRHGHNDSIGKRIVGRHPGVRLDARGVGEADILAERLAGAGITRIFSSPLERALETAAPLAERLGREVSVCDGLQEVHFGDWAGETFEALDRLPRWRQFNTFRSGTRIPGGELMAEVQARMVGVVEALREKHPRDVMALVSHGDPIKTVIAHYLGISLDHMLRLEISLTSVSILQVTNHGPKILCINSLDAVESLLP